MNADSIVDKLLKDNLSKKNKEEIVIERVEEWRSCLNRLFSSPDGQYVAKYLLKYIGLYKADNVQNGIALVESAGKRKVYLELIRPYLLPETINKVENQ